MTTRKAEQIAERRELLDEITADIRIAEYLSTTVDTSTLRGTAADLRREIAELQA
ncbi:MAG: hypothetical protein KAI41_12395 [Hyphomicrobiaceae bacterium]|nr:hypothetical protein [Hyphomicrobiaceae bacterium]